MKIAIITYYTFANYGTLLQAYALWKFLEERGHDVVFPDEPYGRSMFPYKPISIKDFVAKHPFSAAKAAIVRHFNAKMTEFNQIFPRSAHFDSINEMVAGCREYDAVVVGSDLVWHPKWCAPKFTRIAFLDFLSSRSLRVSISPSFSATSWDAPDKELAGQLLRKFNKIGVREKSGQVIVRDISGREDVSVLIDSALLLTGASYVQLLKLKKLHLEDYVFVYMLKTAMNGECQRILETILERKHIAHVKTRFEAPGGSICRSLCKALRIQSYVSVTEWLSRLSNSKFVFTDSFHGTVFSILFHKPFITVRRSDISGLNERLISLLSLLGIEDRFVELGDIDNVECVLHKEINWDAVDLILYKERNKVSGFLSEVGI